MRLDLSRSMRPGFARASLFAALALTGLAGCGQDGGARAAEPAVSATAARTSIVAMARLEPNGRVIRVNAATDDIIQESQVSDGADVVEGQILMKLGSYDLRVAEREEAVLQVQRAELTPFQIEAQQARLRLIEAELAHANGDVEGQRGLIEKGFTPGKEYEEALLRVRRHEEKRNEALADLKQLEASFGLERRQAENALRKAESQLERTLIRAPIEGKILKVLMRPGERTGGGAVIHMGNTSEMYALAEVHATDIRYVRSGQRARFESAALPASIDGTVESIGSMIYTNNIFGEDPGAPAGVRVFQVRVRLDDSEVASRFTNLEGQVRIFVDGSGPS